MSPEVESEGFDHRLLQGLKRHTTTPIYVFVGCIGFALLLYGCKKICDRLFPSEMMFMRSVELEDIELDLGSDDEEKLLHKKKKRARKVMMRPTMQTGSQKLPTQSDNWFTDRHHQATDMDRFFEHHDEPQSANKAQSRHMTPAKYTPSPKRQGGEEEEFKLHTTQEQNAGEQEAGEDSDMWRLWGQTYDHKNSGYGAKPPEQKKDEGDKEYSYQSVKFGRKEDKAQVKSPDKAQVKSPDKSPARPALPKLDLSPLTQQRSPGTAAGSSSAAAPPRPSLPESAQAPPRDTQMSGQLRPLPSSLQPLPRPGGMLPRPGGRHSAPPRALLAPLQSQTQTQTQTLTQSQKSKPPPPRGPPPGYALRPRPSQSLGRPGSSRLRDDDDRSNVSSLSGRSDAV